MLAISEVSLPTFSLMASEVELSADTMTVPTAAKATRVNRIPRSCPFSSDTNPPPFSFDVSDDRRPRD